MLRIKSTAVPLVILAIVVSSPLSVVNSQSGRGRPRVATSAPEAPPEPVKVPEAAGVAKQERLGNVSRFVLHNGLTVIISEQHATPLAAVVAYFKSGRLDESEQTAGVADLLARLLLAGKAKEAVVLGAPGGAYASADHTAFYLLVSPEKLKDALTVQAQMIQSPPVLSDDFQREASSVALDDPLDLSGHDTPADYSRERLKSIALTRRGSARLPDTNTSSATAVTRDQVLELFRAHFRPENLVLSVVGAVSTFNTLVEIQRLYAGFNAPVPNASSPPSKQQPATVATPPKPAPAATAPSSGQTQSAPAQKPPALEPTAANRRPAEPEQTKLRYGADRGDIYQSIVTIGFRGPGLSAKSWPAIEVLAALVGKGRSSRLQRSLVDGQAVVSSVECDYVALADVGLLTIQMKPVSDPNGGSLIDKAESAVFKEMDRLRRVLPSDGELARAQTLVEKRFVDRAETHLGRAVTLAHAEAGGFRAALDFRKLIREVRAEDVQRAAANCFTLAGASVHEYEPNTAPPRTFDPDSFAATVLAWAPALGEPFNPKEVIAPDSRNSPPLVAQGPDRSVEELAALESIEPLGVKDFSTLNGPRAFVREDHSRPKVTIALLFPGGRIAEDETRAGITEIMLRSMLRGTPRRPFAEVSHELEQLGADVEVVAEPDFFGLSAEVLSRNADRTLRILRDLIEEPAFTDRDLDRVRIEQSALIRESLGSSAARSRELLFQVLFAGHQYSLPAHGRQEIIAKLTSEQLREWHERMVKRQVPVAIIVGDTEGSALISGTLAEGFKRRETDAPARYSTPAAPKPADKVEQRKGPRTIFSIGFPGPRGGSDEALAMELIQSAMNGPTGRLFRELGNKQGIVYAARLDSDALLAGGAVHAGVVTSPENEQRARAGVLAEIEKLIKGGLSDDEVAIARAMLVTSRLTRLQSHRERALDYARAILYQRQPSEVDSFADRLAKITPEEIKRVASTYLKPSAASAGIVRPGR